MTVPNFERALQMQAESRQANGDILYFRGLRSHLRRILFASLGSEIVPAFVRTTLLRLLGFDLAKNVCIWPKCDFRSSNVSMGNKTFINIGFFFDGAARLSIGDNVRIGQFVRIITATHDIGPSEQRCEIQAISLPVRIETGCWIGAGVMILPGVTIQHGCVIGAGSVVTRSTEPNGLYVGSPARRIRELPT